MNIASFLVDIWKIIKENTATIALLIFNYEEYKVKRAESVAADALLKLKLKGNADAVAKKYDGMSDSDVVRKYLDSSDDGTDSSSH